MDFPLADPIVELLHTAIGRHDLGYTPGDVARLANAFEGFAARRLNWTIDPGQVTVVTDVMIGGPELECDAMADWARERVGLHFIPPGESWRNSYVESFNSRIRDECLNINIFWSLAQARVVITDWKQDYSHRRRHSSLGYQAPAVYAAACAHW